MAEGRTDGAKLCNGLITEVAAQPLPRDAKEKPPETSERRFRGFRWLSLLFQRSGWRFQGRHMGGFVQRRGLRRNRRQLVADGLFRPCSEQLRVKVASLLLRRLFYFHLNA